MTFSALLEYALIGLFVVFFFGLCIIVHELGHLVAALWRGLHVERFSIGFGKKIWGFQRNGVDYWISWVPFGGYVALPQLEPSEEPVASDGRKLPPAKPLDKIIAALAGPVCNVIFGFLLAAVVWWVGVYKPAPATYCDVLTVPTDSAEYAAGLRPDDRILAVNGRTFSRGWNDVAELIVLSPGEVRLALERGGKPMSLSYSPRPNPELEGLGYPFFRVRTPTVVHQVKPGYPAALAGIRAGDVILKFNDTPIEDAAFFIDMVRQSQGRPFDVEVGRQGQRQLIKGLVAQADDVEGQTLYRVGAEIDAPYVLTHPSPWFQFTNVIDKTIQTLRPLFTRGSLVKPRHMSSVVGIAQVIGVKVYTEGLRGGLAFIVFLTFSLGIINLLPIPVLDGGHITMALIEMVMRRRVPVRVAYALTVTFASLLIAFMLYVTYYDIKRTGLIWKHIRPRQATPTTEAPAKPPATPAAATTGESPVVAP